MKIITLCPCGSPEQASLPRAPASQPWLCLPAPRLQFSPAGTGTVRPHTSTPARGGSWQEESKLWATGRRSNSSTGLGHSVLPGIAGGRRPRFCCNFRHLQKLLCSEKLRVSTGQRDCLKEEGGIQSPCTISSSISFPNFTLRKIKEIDHL